MVGRVAEFVGYGVAASACKCVSIEGAILRSSTQEKSHRWDGWCTSRLRTSCRDEVTAHGCDSEPSSQLFGR
jgi:hypothetical protein